MKKMVIKIAQPADASLDKVRVYVATFGDSASLHRAENIVYDGALIAEVKTEQYTNGALNYVGVEYYNDAGKKLRALRSAPRGMLTDLGPWEYATENRIAAGDEWFGTLTGDHPEIPSEMRVRNMDFNNLFTSIASKVGFFAVGTNYASNPETTINALTVNGKLLLLPSVSVSYSTTPANVHAYYRNMMALPASERRITIGGYVWEADFITSDDIAQSIPFRLNTTATNARTDAINVASNIADDPFSGYAAALPKAVLEQATPATIYGQSFANAVYDAAKLQATIVPGTIAATSSTSFRTPLVLRYVGQG